MPVETSIGKRGVESLKMQMLGIGQGAIDVENEGLKVTHHSG